MQETYLYLWQDFSSSYSQYYGETCSLIGFIIQRRNKAVWGSFTKKINETLQKQNIDPTKPLLESCITLSAK